MLNLLCKSSLFSRVFLVLAVTITAGISAPYGPDGIATEFNQPGFGKINLRVFGDEFHARTETTDGHTVVFNPLDQSYHYALRSADGSSLVPSGILAHMPPPQGLAKKLKLSPEASLKIRRANQAKFDGDRQKNWERRVKAFRKVKEIANGLGPAPAAGDEAAAAQTAADQALSAPVNGAKIGLTILAQFPDDPNTGAVDPVNFPTDQAKIQRYCNNVSYTEDGNTGSVRDYFSDQSLGTLTYTQSVTQIVTLPHPRNYYNYSNYPANTTLQPNGTPGRMIVTDAIAVLKAANFDFSNLSTTSNQVIATNVFFAGETSGVWAQGLWPHAWAMSYPGINVGTAQSPKYIYQYQITNINNATPVVGTFIHENGHLLLGYPDLYDYGGDSEGVGNHCLMAAGNHSNGGRTPSPINLYFKEISGWSDIVDYTANQSTVAILSTTGNMGRRIRKTGLATEYVLVENRGTGDKWAANVPDKGIAIWHIDEAKNGNDEQQMTNALHYEVSLEQADGLFDMENNRDRGDAQDLFDSLNPNFTDFTTPNANWWDGTASDIRIHVTSAPGANMTVEFGPPPNSVTVKTPNGGEQIPLGSTQTITWDSNVAGNLKIDLYKAGIFHTELSASEANDGSFSWIVSTILPAGTDYTIRISSVTTPAYADTSNTAFSLTSVPEIAVEQPVGTNLIDGTASVSFGTLALGASAPLTFTVKNTGTAALTGLALTKDGAHSTDFTVGALGATTLAVGTSTTFTVTFSPSAAGTRTAAIHLASNDADENPFDINFTGAAATQTLIHAYNDIPGQGAVWKYLVSATYPGDSWKTSAHDVTSWLSGKPEFGYGDGDEVTNFGNIDTDPVTAGIQRPITNYFRHSFTVANPGAVSGLTIRLKRDDGAIIYLNGQEVFRSNMPTGTITHTTLASNASDDGNTWFTQVLTPAQSVLVQGNNVVAVEIHNSATTSSDISFDFELTGVMIAVPEIAVEQPVGTGLTDGTATIDCSSSDLAVSSAPLTVTVRNTGTAPLTGLALTQDGTNSADFVASALATTSLAPGETTAFVVTFTPSAVGARTAALHLLSNDTDENPFDIALTGTGVGHPEIAVEQPVSINLVDGTANIACGSVNLGSASPPVTFTVKNTGTANLTGLVLTKDGTHNTDFTLGSLGATTLAAGASTTFTVTFSPGAAGARTAAIHLASNDADENPFDIALTGTGVTIPEIAVEQPAGTDLLDGTASVNFGSVDQGSNPATLTFTVKNPGTGDLTGLVLTKDGAHPTDFTLGSLGATTLAAGASTTFTVTFAPGAAGARTAAIHLASNDANENPFDINLTGTGRTPLESWRFAKFGITENTGNAANDIDSDGDRMPNLMEYALALNPQTDEPFPFVTAEDGTTVSITYPRNLAATDVIVSFEECTDLGISDSWGPADVVETNNGPPANGVQSITATHTPPPGQARVFLRMKVAPAP